MKKSITSVEVSGKRILLRADFNVPLETKAGQTTVADDYRIRKALPTIGHIVENGGRLAICAHLGRPQGCREADLSLKPVAARLGELLDRNVKFVDDCIGEEVARAVAELDEGEVLVLENTRFHAEEKKNDDAFAKSLAEPFELFCSDAFGAAHRAHTSTVGVTEYLPSVQGHLMQDEVKTITEVMEHPETPMVVIMGGAKISDKIGVIERLAARAQTVLTGGGIANTFVAARGGQTGDSLVDIDSIDEAKALDKRFPGNIVVPHDFIVVDEVKAGAKSEVVPASEVPEGKIAVDIGEKTITRYEEILREAKTIIWNGPMGVFEIDEFANGTNRVAEILADLDATVVCGGGDSAAAVHEGGYADRFTHVSTGGGAFLELIECGSLPGVDAIDDS